MEREDGALGGRTMCARPGRFLSGVSIPAIAQSVPIRFVVPGPPHIARPGALARRTRYFTHQIRPQKAGRATQRHDKDSTRRSTKVCTNVPKGDTQGGLPPCAHSFGYFSCGSKKSTNALSSPGKETKQRFPITPRLFATPGFPPASGRPGPGRARPWALPIRSGPSGLLTTARTLPGKERKKSAHPLPFCPGMWYNGHDRFPHPVQPIQRVPSGDNAPPPGKGPVSLCGRAHSKPKIGGTLSCANLLPEI